MLNWLSLASSAGPRRENKNFDIFSRWGEVTRWLHGILPIHGTSLPASIFKPTVYRCTSCDSSKVSLGPLCLVLGYAKCDQLFSLVANEHFQKLPSLKACKKKKRWSDELDCFMIYCGAWRVSLRLALKTEEEEEKGMVAITFYKWNR